MRTDTYSLNELIQIATMDNGFFYLQIQRKTIDANMRFCMLLRKSLTELNKKIKNLDIELAIVNKAQIVENFCRPHIYRKHFINIAAKYPNDTEERHKELAKEKTEKTVAKYTLY